MPNESYLSKGTKHQKDVSTLNQCEDSGILQFNDSPVWLLDSHDKTAI